MNKILTLFKREYRAAVRTKSFLISLILVPIMMGGGFAAFIIMENRQDTDDTHFAVIDHTGELEGFLNESLKQRNTNDIIDPETGDTVDGAYIVDFLEPDREDPTSQRLMLSERVKSAELHGFLEIGSGFLSLEGENVFLRYYSEHSFNDPHRRWFSNVLNNEARKRRAEALNLDEQQRNQLTAWIGVEGMGLVSVDKKTGEQVEAKETDELQSFLVPYVLMILMFMLAMMSAIPLLTTVMEEKSEKIAEVLLGTITPFQFMMGKVVGGVAVALTTAAIYIAAGVFTMNRLGVESMIPYDILPWFFVFAIFFVLMLGSGMAALGATANDNKEAQSLTFPGILPAIIPMFLIAPVLQDPTGTLATTLSLIPPFTPSMMVIRMASPVTIPAWQPITGLIGVVLFTILTVWIGARIFRTAILIQGQKPTLKNLVKYAFKS